MHTPRWKWFGGWMLAAALVACGDNDSSQPDAATPGARPPDTQPPDAQAPDAQPPSDARPGDAGVADAGLGMVCPMAEELWADVDVTAFRQLSDLRWLYITNVTPGEVVTYWELRRSAGSGFSVLLRAGEKCADAANPDLCRAEFDTLVAQIGFGPSCLPGFCYQYIAVNRGDTNQLIVTREEVPAFLGNIDSPVEAALLAHAHGYTWDATKPEAGSVRAVGDGYQLLVTELTKECDPVITDRVLLHAGNDGTVEVVRRQVYEALCGACI